MIATDVPNISLNLKSTPSFDVRYRNKPTSSEIAVLLPGDGSDHIAHRDIILKTRINELHSSYDPLQYRNSTNKYVTCRKHYAYRFIVRQDDEIVILRSKRLFHQFIVDSYAKQETLRLNFIRNNQSKLRAVLYQGIHDAILEGDTNADNLGRRIILPSSFTGGPRHMLSFIRTQWLLYAALVNHHYSLLSPATLNDEIMRELFPHQTPNDRPDLVCRVFRQKLKCLKKVLLYYHVLGKVIAYIDVIEFQKRGLPHCHMCLILYKSHRLPTADTYDDVVCSEIPNKITEPKLFQIISNFNTHGPCGITFPNSPCMIDGKCSKKYPKSFVDTSSIDKNLFVQSIKYIYKYCYKGHDRTTASVSINNVDETTQFIDARYISAIESLWRTLDFEMQDHSPAVYRLDLHLPNQHIILFQSNTDINNILTKNPGTRLTEWFKINQLDTDARHYIYADFVRYYVWKPLSKQWIKRKRGGDKDIGRIRTVSPKEDFSKKISPEPDNLITENLALCHINQILIQNGKSLKDFLGMPIPLLSTQSPSATVNIRCHLIREEISYDTDDMYKKYLANYNLFNLDQNIIYAKIMSVPSTPYHNLFFIDGPGGTGKSFLLNTILFNLRAQGKIAIAVASSGIALTLFHNGHTAHSRFNIPLSIHESSSCNITYQSQIAELIRQSVIIIWDKISMTHKHIFEAVDRSFQDIMKLDKPFGGKIIIFGGDFRQILPVIKRGGRCDIVNSTLKRSYLWSHIVPLRLCINMRLLQFQEANDYLINNKYSKFLLRVGEGCETFDGSRDKIKIPQDCCIASNDIEDLIAFVYDIDKDNSSFNRTSFAQNAILTPKNVDVDSINIKLINEIPGDLITYISADETITEDEATFYHTEFLNSLSISGLPPHKLLLKVGVPIILMHNLNSASGLNNGTKLIITSLLPNIIEAEFVSGSFLSTKVLIPIINLIPTDSGLPFSFKRRQFPVRPADN
ncbi:uncharacterized protein LOC135923630 [Gordionus sp. m RMFG-2023]|uniref:uncharacterized protein LOC135923630 n=1 Tax=Gordionus sp. m RMFG-2023 TaxID=3053472 RepID=UPI0031FCF2CD